MSSTEGSQGRIRRGPQAIQPKEGSTGWSDTWMINSKTKHLNCAYKWLDYIVSPKANDAVAEWFGEAPANSKAMMESCLSALFMPRHRPVVHSR